MSRSTPAGGVIATLLALLIFGGGYWVLTHDGDPALEATRFLHQTLDDETSAARASSPATAAMGSHEGLLYGRVATHDGTLYEGRLRWGGDEEALWGNTFNGFKSENPWVAYAPPEHRSIGAFGFEIAGWEEERNVRRPFMARFGDIAYIEPRGREIRVALRSDAEVVLDRFGADDLADGVRVWDAGRGMVDIGEWEIRIIELLPFPGFNAGSAAANTRSAPYPLHGTVRTRQGDFTGLIQWNRRQALVSDGLVGNAADGERRLRFDNIRSIARRSGEGSLVTLLDGTEIGMSGTSDVGGGNRGVYVDDLRYGRVLISWDAFERVDFSPGSAAGPGPGYDEFPQARPLAGSVVTRAGRRLSGRLVYDLDESETIETLDAPSQGIDYLIPLGLIASIVPRGVETNGGRLSAVTLHGGEELQLERSGDLGEQNAGLLIFVNGRDDPEYVAWKDIERIELDRPARMYPPAGTTS